MPQFQSVNDPFGISRLVDQININRKDRAQQPIRDLQKQLLQGQVQQQQGQLSDLTRQRQDTIDLRAEMDAAPDVNKRLTAINFFDKRNPKLAGDMRTEIWEEAGNIMKTAGGAAAIKHVNDNTGQSFKYLGKKGEFDEIDLGDKVVIYDAPNDKIVREFPKAQKGGEVIETLPDGTVRISRGASARPKKFTETQSKSGGFADRVQSANEILNTLEDSPSFDPAGISETIAGNVPLAGNLLISPEKQQYNQAKENFITANLRLESGAAIGKDEFVKEDKKFFPQPGDKPPVLKQKKEARRRQLDILAAASGGFFEEIQKQRKERDGTEETPEIDSQEKYDKLPSGTVFIENGKKYRKP